MISFIDKIFLRNNNLDYFNKDIKFLSSQPTVKKIFDSINNFSKDSEIRFVGGCIRKILKKEIINDIDLATNLQPEDICKALNENNISFYKTGIKHGTITAIIDNQKFEITSLRVDEITDGRHAQVKFSTDWKLDASRRDFTINSIYSDLSGNLFDPFNGKNDLEKGIVKFIGDPNKRIEEDYLRIIRYLRFFLQYSNIDHDDTVLKTIKKNLKGILGISKDRLLDEFKKFIDIKILSKLANDDLSLEIFEMVFPEFKNVKFFANLNKFAKKKIDEKDLIFLISLLVIDGSDNTDYFIYKYNLSNQDKKRLMIINDFYREKITSNRFSEKNLNKFFYYHGKQAVLDILNYKLFRLKKIDQKILDLIDEFSIKQIPIMPFNAKHLIDKFNFSEGKNLGNKLKTLEEAWVNNDFKLSETQIEKIINR